MRILLDLDSCIFDFIPSFYSYIESVSNPYNAILDLKPKCWSMWKYMDISKDEWSAYMHDYATSRGFREGRLVEPEIPQIIKRLSDKHEVAVVTARHVPFNGLKKQIITDTIDWLDKNGIIYNEICFVNKKSTVLGDILLDDAEHNLEDFSKVGMSVAYDTSYNQNWIGNRVKTWVEFESFVRKYE